MADDHGARGVPPGELSDEDLTREPNHPHRGSEQVAGRRTEYDPDQPDFAEEHNSMTFADELPGGLERVEEPESPRGLAGLEPEWPASDTV